MKSYSIVTGDPGIQLIISNINVSYLDFNNGNPYNTVFTVEVTSGDFVGKSKFEYNIKEFVRFVREIRDLYNFKLNFVELNDICYGSNIQFSLSKKGHITISGTIFGTAREHSLVFKFTTDQTALAPFSNSLYKDYVTEHQLKV
jgi:hypothetical protein